MNWRGRPLTSHEVVVDHDRHHPHPTGLRVHAELDTGTYPLGIAVTQRANCGRCRSSRTTITGSGTTPSRPPAAGRPPVTADDRARARAAGPARLLADPRLTGMSSRRTRRARRAARSRASTPRPRSAASNNAADHAAEPPAPAAGRCSPPPTGPDHRRLPAPGLLPEGAVRPARHQRRSPSARRSPKPDSCSPSSSHHQPTAHYGSPRAADLRDWSPTATGPDPTDPGSRPARPPRPDRHDPRRPRRHDRARRTVPEPPQVERHRHRRRGGDRLPGARGGVFTQKITDDERILATVLYQRGLCTQDTLAELFEVSRRTIGNVIREVGPLLTQDGHTRHTPHPLRHSSRLPRRSAGQPTPTKHQS